MAITMLTNSMSASHPALKDQDWELWVTMMNILVQLHWRPQAFHQIVLYMQERVELCQRQPVWHHLLVMACMHACKV